MAVATVMSPKHWAHWEKARLDVTMMDPCSYRRETSWKKRFAASASTGMYPSSSMISRWYLFRRLSTDSSRPVLCASVSVLIHPAAVSNSTR